jgi:hypothetical protein
MWKWGRRAIPTNGIYNEIAVAVQAMELKNPPIRWKIYKKL